MAAEVHLAGFTLTHEEWQELDEEAKALLRHALLEAPLGEPGDDEPYYASYQVIWPVPEVEVPDRQLRLL